MKLYYRADCPFCWKVRLALHYFEVAYESVEVQLGEKHPDVTRLSLTGTVPIAVDNGLVMTDSAVIMEYINDAFAGGELIPGGVQQRARLREIQSYSDKLFGKPLFVIAQQKRAKPPADWDQQAIREGTSNWYRNLDYLAKRVRDESLLATKIPSLVECTLLPRFALAELYGVPVDARHPDLFIWFESWKEQEIFLQTRPKLKLIRTI